MSKSKEISFISQFYELRTILPESIRNLVVIFIDPNEKELLHMTIRDFFATALLVGVVLTITKSALPTAFIFDGVAGINPLILTIMLILNGLITSSVFYCISSIPVLIKSRRPAENKMFFQCIRTFSILNLITPILAIIAINRLASTYNLLIAPSDFDMWFGGVIALLAFFVVYRLLIKTSAKYFEKIFNKKTSIVIAILTVSLSSYANLGYSLSFYKYLIDTGTFCEALVEQQFEKQIIEGSVNYYQRKLKCKKLLDSQ
ncbi:MAG: hypothetical protein COB83_12785 [Gammaproteobacteria bacterium]|nr:MAG: hypothetical protein COB83_12785 [Gammaproteobacteria bacterium]